MRWKGGRLQQSVMTVCKGDPGEGLCPTALRMAHQHNG